MYITVVGGGNSTLVFACQAKLAGHEVAILTRSPLKWAKDNVIGFENQDKTYLEGKEQFEAKVDLITDDYSQCIPKSDIIFIAGLPIHFNRDILEKIKPHMKLEREKPVLIGSVCGYGGFNWLVADVLGKGNYIIFATGQIPWTCGTKEYGKTGYVFGQKVLLRVSTESSKEEADLRNILSGILKITNIMFTGFLCGTLYPNNPSVHPPILYSLFKDWDKNSDKKFEFKTPEAPERIYCDLTEDAAKCIEVLNDEHVEIIKALYKLFPEDKSLEPGPYNYKQSLILAYGDQIKDSTTTYSAVRSCTAYLKHKNPYIFVDAPKEKQQEGENGNAVAKQYVIPNIAHKFFTTDLPYGLCTYKDIAIMLGIDTPFMDKIIVWNQKLIDKEYLVDGKLTGKDIGECILPSKFGVTKENLNRGNRK